MSRLLAGGVCYNVSIYSPSLTGGVLEVEFHHTSSEQFDGINERHQECLLSGWEISDIYIFGQTPPTTKRTPLDRSRPHFTST